MTRKNDAAPAANGARIGLHVTSSYTAPRLSATGRIGARLSPRRRLHAQLVLTFLCRNRYRWRDGEVRLVPDTYVLMADELELDRFAVNQAIDDLYALGLIDVRLSRKTQVVVPLASSIEEAA